MVRASGICLEGPGFNPQSGHLFCLTELAFIEWVTMKFRAEIQLLTCCYELASRMWVTMVISELKFDYWYAIVKLYPVCRLFSFYPSNCSLVQHSIGKTRHIESSVKVCYHVKIFYSFIFIFWFIIIIQMPSLPALAALADSLFHILFLFLTTTLTAILICLENSFWHTQQGSTLEDGFHKAWNSYLAMKMDNHFISQWPNDQFTFKSF